MGMMVLILVICTVAVWAFIKTYKKEMRAKAAAEAERSARNASEPVTEADQDAA